MPNDFRVTFATIADQAIVTRTELAELLATTPAAISQMAFLGELPATAFPAKRRACWYARDIRRWLDETASSRVSISKFKESTESAGSGRTGRRRLPTE